jgi:cytoskeletal protein RodZ
VFEIGSSLRDARVRKGLELPTLEAETKIRAKYLRALEEERFDLLPGDTYVKGFLRIYAEKLGLDGQLYVDEYNSRFSLTEEPVVANRPRGRARQGRFEASAVVVALAGIVAVTVLVIAAWRLGGDDDGGEPTTAAPAATAAESGPGATTAAAGGEAAPPVQLILTVRKGTSQVVVRRGSARGEVLWEGTLSKGDDQPVEGTKLWLFVERSQNLALTLNGEAMPPIGRGSHAVVVTEDGVELADDS